MGPRRTRTPRPRPPLALELCESQTLLDIFYSECLCDSAPASVYVTLLDKRIYLASVRTMYRLLASHGGSPERRSQLYHPAYTKPELLAGQPNEVCSSGITKLKRSAKWTGFQPYMMLDIFSRYVVGWLIAERETAELATQMISRTVARYDLQPGGRLTLHVDRGASMRSKPVAALLVDLDVARIHSRPHVSDDNPYSESQFKSMKYHPDFPDRFGCIAEAGAYCQNFFTWYITEHRHSGIGLMTPHSVHYGLAKEMRAARQITVDAAFLAHPNRLKSRNQQPPVMPVAEWINPPKKKIATAFNQQPCKVNL